MKSIPTSGMFSLTEWKTMTTNVAISTGQRKIRHNIYITDKTGAKFFDTNASPTSLPSAAKNLTRHMEQARSMPDMCNNIDVATMVLMLNDVPY